MIENLDNFDPMPSPLHLITTYTAPEAERALRIMAYITVEMMESLPWRAQSALKHFFNSTYPPLRDLDPQTTYQVSETPNITANEDRPVHTLLEALRAVIKFNRPPSTYNVASPFYRTDYNVKAFLPRETQLAITEALKDIEQLEHFYAELDRFWQTPDPFTSLTFRDVFARILASTLQCEAILRLNDQSLSLDTIALLTRLALPDTLEHCHLYRVSIYDEALNTQIPLVGAFVISQHAEAPHVEKNMCALYIPGSTLREFDSPALLKTLLASDLNLVRHRHLLTCMPLAQQLRAEQLTQRGLSAGAVNFTAVTYSSTHFYNEQVQLLIEKQRADIQHAWSTVPQALKQKAYWPDELIRQAGHITPLLTFPDILKQHAPYVPASDHPLAPPVITPSRAARLQAVKIHVYVHQDLAGQHGNNALQESYFSWVIQEIERVSGRDVMVFFNPAGTPEAVTNFDYQNAESPAQALVDWKALVKQHLAKTATADTRLHLFLLLTHNPINHGTFGIAEAIGGQFALASITKYRVVGHEIGHLLGAKHEDGAIIYNGWWHDTVMRSADFFSPLRGQAYRFSDANRLNIHKYLRKFS